MALLNEKLLNELLNKQYPIGKTEFFLDNEDHSNYMGFTWQLDSTGRVPVGLDTSDTDFNVIGKTGGSKYLQEHTHKPISLSGTPIVAWNSQSGSTNNYAIEDTYKTTGTANQNYFATGNVSDVATGTSGNLQPYKVFAIWVRIA